MLVAQAINDFMFFFPGLMPNPTAYEYMISRPFERSVEMAEPRVQVNCPECGIKGASRYALSMVMAAVKERFSGLSNFRKTLFNAALTR